MTELDPKIIARFREATPPYLGATYVRLAQEIRDEAVVDLTRERNRLWSLMDAAVRYMDEVPGDLIHALAELAANPTVERAPLLCDNCGQSIAEHLQANGLLSCRPDEDDQPTGAVIHGWGVWHADDEEWIGFGVTNGIAAELIPEGYDHLSLRYAVARIDAAEDDDRCTRCNRTAWECATQFTDVGFGPMCCEDCSHVITDIAAFTGADDPSSPANTLDDFWHCRCGTRYGSAYPNCPACGQPRHEEGEAS